MYSFRVLETRSLKSRCQLGHTSSKASRGASFLASFSFWQLQAFLGLWQPSCNFCVLSSYGSLPPVIPVSLRGILLFLWENQSHWIACDHTLIQCDLIFLSSFFYCCSITVVWIFSPPLHPTPAKPTSLPRVHSPPWFCPCVLYSSSWKPLTSY